MRALGVLMLHAVVGALQVREIAQDAVGHALESPLRAGLGGWFGHSTPVAEQVHIALAGRGADGYPDRWNVAWYTSSKVGCRVHWGVASVGAALPNVTAAAVSTHYWIWTGEHHSVTIGPLVEGVRYAYEVHCGADSGAAAAASKSTSVGKRFEATFRTRGDGLSISVFGDMGYLGSAARRIIIHIEGLKKNWSAVPTRTTLEGMKDAGEIDMVWHVGDIGYADDSYDHNLVGGNYESVYNGYMNWMQNLTAAVPYMVSPGNHESECHSPWCVVNFLKGKSLSNFTAFNHRFHMPSAESGGVLNMWYSWNYGPAHFVSLNTETDFPGAGEEHRGDSKIFSAGGFRPAGVYMRWLEADLKQAAEDRARGKIGFIIAGGHRTCCKDIPGVEALFAKYGVDLYLSGHIHKYFRSYKSCVPPACESTDASVPSNASTTYVVAGGAGNDEMDYGHRGPTSSGPSVPFATEEMATGVLTLHNASSLQYRLLSSLDRRVLDEFWLKPGSASGTGGEY
eukprot:TRINITY_DN6546_c0_g1_i1.p1 TRINITY_DN6546_c0_g1~~TRINITY_DN6546_c0_g1_i1.p1  ORF type:complete len:510 (+),score=138.41 TRINITY_DN6546_c0_g1_i1:69-1598(+)